MFTYGYIRQAVMAHLDIDEDEAQSVKILERLHIFANEAMQAICSNKPMYQYIDITVVDKYAPLVMDGAFIRPATVEEINWDVEEKGPLPVAFLNDDATKEYYHNKGIYERGETISMSDTFISFASKQGYKIYEKKPSYEEVLEAEAFGKRLKPCIIKENIQIDYDISYISKNKIKVYKPGRYLIPAKFMWYRFDSGLGDEAEIDMPSDIFLCIPLYISSICLQIDDLQKSNMLRNEFEAALARCTSTDLMPVNELEIRW